VKSARRAGRQRLSLFDSITALYLQVKTRWRGSKASASRRQRERLLDPNERYLLLIVGDCRNLLGGGVPTPPLVRLLKRDTSAEDAAAQATQLAVEAEVARVKAAAENAARANAIAAAIAEEARVAADAATAQLAVEAAASKRLTWLKAKQQAEDDRIAAEYARAEEERRLAKRRLADKAAAAEQETEEEPAATILFGCHGLTSTTSAETGERSGGVWSRLGSRPIEGVRAVITHGSKGWVFASVVHAPKDSDVAVDSSVSVPDKFVVGLPTGCTLWCKVVPSKNAKKSDWYATYAAEWKKGRGKKNAASPSGKRKQQHQKLIESKGGGDADAEWTTVGPKQARHNKKPRAVRTDLGDNKRKKQPKRFVVTLA
jgi:hypothetical protein